MPTRRDMPALPDVVLEDGTMLDLKFSEAKRVASDNPLLDSFVNHLDVDLYYPHQIDMLKKVASGDYPKHWKTMWPMGYGGSPKIGSFAHLAVLPAPYPKTHWALSEAARIAAESCSPRDVFVFDSLIRDIEPRVDLHYWAGLMGLGSYTYHTTHALETPYSLDRIDYREMEARTLVQDLLADNRKSVPGFPLGEYSTSIHGAEPVSRCRLLESVALQGSGPWQEEAPKKEPRHESRKDKRKAKRNR